jgi:hypothetical protein
LSLEGEKKEMEKITREKKTERIERKKWGKK